MNSINKIKSIFESNFSSIGKEVRQEQINVIQSVLNGKNTLCLMPTGSGKSLCYWIAGKALEGITIVIFPLTALMDEQAKKLSQHGCKVLSLHSGISSKDQYDELALLYNGDLPDFIFLSPERLSTDGFLEFVLKSIRDRIKLIVVDEIHCISQWGFNFRPFYKEIPGFIKNVFEDTPPPLLGLTATLNPKDKEEICRDFDIAYENIIRSRYLLRSNINLQIEKIPNENEKDIQLWDTIEQRKYEKILVYLDRVDGKRSTEELCKEAIKRGYNAAYFHGELSSEIKSQIIEEFKNNTITLLFATNAFGMGIDIPDIRGIIHYLPPESIEQYYQQIGRAGRDKQPAWAKLLYSDKNIDVRKKYFIEKSFPTNEQIQKSFEVLTDNKIGKKSFSYFEEKSAQSAYHYIIRSGLVDIRCKAIQKLNVFEATATLPEFEEYIQATKTSLLTATSKKLGLNEKDIVQSVFLWLSERKIKVVKAPSKCLIVESKFDKLSEEKLAEILSDVEVKKKFKYSNFDDFIQLLNGYKNHTQFHQSIGKYLGIDKFELGRIHQTLSGVMVRSKSEVIIANILHDNGITFEYEQELCSPDGILYSPDFTITSNNKTYFWEHLGMLEDEDYANNWKIKKAWYEKHFPGQLITTEECSVLSKRSENIVNTTLASSKIRLN
ncbi:MAG: RecQ family ATP-dependent DNA helicase [Sporocytophaga sp.]|nr:RecQ family ATP-dependent DNA helicase [Sporocytophaga sp.]